MQYSTHNHIGILLGVEWESDIYCLATLATLVLPVNLPVSRNSSTQESIAHQHPCTNTLRQNQINIIPFQKASHLSHTFLSFFYTQLLF